MGLLESVMDRRMNERAFADGRGHDTVPWPMKVALSLDDDAVPGPVNART